MTAPGGVRGTGRLLPGLRALPGPAEGKAAPAVLGWRHRQCRGQPGYPAGEAVCFHFGQEEWSISPTP